MPPAPDSSSPPPHSGLRWSGLSHVGKVRKNNEDSFLGLYFDAQEAHFLGKHGEASLEHNDFVFAVSDGMGGAHAGEFASRVAVEKITRLLPRSYRQAAGGINPGFQDVLPQLFAEIHKALLFLGQSYEDCAGMGATLSLAWFSPGWMYFAHLGDSRIYFLPGDGGPMKQLTEDDTYVGWMFRQGQINEREARTHPRRNLLQKALGAGHQFVDPQVGAVGCEPGDRFLLCTDGVVEGLYNYQLEEILRPPAGESWPEHPAKAVVEGAVERSGTDNTTAVVVEVR